MPDFPIFLSIVFVLRNQSESIKKFLLSAASNVSSYVIDYEIVVIDNASDDDSLSMLKDLTQEDGLPNLQVFALTKEVDTDTAAWVGLENALGDFVVVIDPRVDDFAFLPEMLDKAANGVDVVFANNRQLPRESLTHRAARAAFNRLYKFFNGVDLARDAPQYRVLSRRVVNYILQHHEPAVTYRHLPCTGGFSRVNLTYSAAPMENPVKKVADSIDRGIRILVSTTRAPLRIITFLALFGAVGNAVYSVYVFVAAMTNPDIAPGWASLSLQLSGMFFLISLVLLVLGEYILHMASLASKGPKYYIGQEFTSARMTRREKLNIEEVSTSHDQRQFTDTEVKRFSR